MAGFEHEFAAEPLRNLDDGTVQQLGASVTRFPVSYTHLDVYKRQAENRIDPVPAADAGRELLGNMLFFAEDQEMVHWAFRGACDFVHRVPVYRLTFMPDARVWEMIG